MQPRDGWEGRWGRVREGGTKMEHRKAINDGSVTRHWQRLRAQRRDARRLEERERERGQQSPTTPPFHPTPPVSPPPQSIWPCQNIKCMLLLLSKRCLRFLKALIRGRVDGNQGIFSCAKRGNNTQLIIAQQRGLDCVCKECAGQITTLHSTRRGPTKGAGQGFELSLHKPTLRFVYGESPRRGMSWWHWTFTGASVRNILHVKEMSI